MDLPESYRILELEKTNSLQEVKEAYRDIVFVWHPDRLENKGRIQKKAEKKLQKINLAYSILKNHLSDKLPQFEKIIISPELVELHYHESKIFTVFGIDSEHNQIPIEQVKWEASGGVIYQDGLFFADDKIGDYTITAKFGSCIAQAKVKLTPIPTETSNQDSPSWQQKLKTKFRDYFVNHPLVTKLVQVIESIRHFADQFLVMIKWLLWLAISWFIMTTTYLNSETISFLPRLTLILFLSWLMSIISPHLTIDFGITQVNNKDTSVTPKAQVSLFYSVLTTIVFGFTLATSPFLFTQNFNSVQNWILGVLSLTTIVTFVYPEGSVMSSIITKNPQQARLTIGFSCLLILLFWLGIISLF